MCIRDSSNTQTINPGARGNNEGERIDSLVNVMDGYFDQGAHHLNVNAVSYTHLDVYKRQVTESGWARHALASATLRS